MTLEESCIRGLDTFIQSKGQIKASVVFIFLAFLLHVIGFATPGWVDYESSRIGLWTHCDSSTNYECCQSAERFVSTKGNFSAIKKRFKKNVSVLNIQYYTCTDG